MARLRVLGSPSAKLRTGGYKGEPSGKIELTENHKTYNVADYAEAETNIPDPVLIEKSVTENGTYSAEDDRADGYSEVTVNVPIPVPALESKTATPTAIQFDVEPSVGFDGLSKVTVLAALFGIDTESLSHFEFGIDSDGLYYTDEVGGGTPVYIGVDARGLYVTGGNANA